MNRGARVLLIIIGTLLAIAGFAILAVLAILPSPWFEEKIRVAMVEAVERTTGGRTEAARFHLDWKTLTVTVDKFVLHGKEPAGQDPLVRADSVTAGLRIISLIEKKFDLASVTINHLRVNVLVDRDGHTNFPEPKVKHDVKDPIQTVLQLKIGKIALNDGLVHVNDQRVPLELRAENLRASLKYDFLKPRYFGDVSIRQTHLESGTVLALAVDVDANVSLERGVIRVPQAHIAMEKTQVDASGTVEDVLHPKVDFDVKAVGNLNELAKPLDIPRNITQPGAGTVTFEGKVTYSAAADYLIAGRVEGSGIAVRGDGFHVANISGRGVVRFDKHEITLEGLSARALGGIFQGNASIRDFRKFSAKGHVSGITIGAVAQTVQQNRVEWSGTMAGPVEVSATLSSTANDLKFSGQLTVLPANTGIPMEGVVNLAYDQRSQKVNFGDSVLRTGSSSTQFHGTLGERLDVKLDSKDLHDLLPALAFTSDHPPPELPLKLTAGGEASFAGTVSGQLTNPQISGDVSLTHFEAAGEKIDSFTATGAAGRDAVQLRNFVLHQAQLQLEGNGSVGLQNWKVEDASAISASVRVQGADVGKLIETYGHQKLPVGGIASGLASVSGTLASPKAVLQAVVEKVAIYGETFDHFRGEIRYQPTGVEVLHGEFDQGKSTILVSGAYQREKDDWTSGRLNFDLSSARFTLQQLKYVQDLKEGLEGAFDLKAAGSATIQKGEPVLNALNGRLSLQSFVVEGRTFGNVALEAKTSGPGLHLSLTGDVATSKITGSGDFQITGDGLGNGHLEIPPLKLSALQDLLKPNDKQKLPFDGEITAVATFSGPLLKPAQMTGRVEIPRVEVTPTQMPDITGKQARDLTVKNSKPIVFDLDTNGIHIKSAEIVGLDTNLKASGVFSFRDPKRPWDIQIVGNANLAILQDFQAGLTSSGGAIVDANVRGTRDKPLVTGRMEFKNAAFSMADLPNGIDQAAGVVIFDQNRATIVDRITAQTGGGEIALTGFVGYGSGEVIYRLQSTANVVRVRLEGVSLTANASLSLTGTSARSILSGSITVLKAGFNPKTDIGSLLLASAGPVAAPAAPSEFLRGMQLDVHIDSAPNLQFQTSLSSNLQAEMDLRLRGNAGRPALLGHITVNQGDIQFFGNKYAINRGEVGFYNTVKIEPVLDLDLETQAAGVTVDLTLTGTLSKLNMSYRSDPPLQSNEIIALLTVGRSPTSNSQLASSQTVSPENSLATSTNSLLGQAISSPVSSRLQRFFGVSRLKIDPLLTGVNAVPQARLTIEQQISKDITLTYVTNLTQANDQLVKFEWDLNKNWSVVAIREENGIFGIDFFYKKRFK
jgi:translocation and assembly module TamB